MLSATLRIVSYNIDADTTDFSNQGGYLETVLEGISATHLNDNGTQNAQPIDVLALQETKNSAGSSTAPSIAQIVSALNAKYGAGIYAADPTQDPTDGAGLTGNGPNALIYNTTTVQVRGATPLGSASSSGAPRAPMQYLLQPVGFSIAAEFYLDVSHMKSGTDSTSANRRGIEATTITGNVSSLGANAHVIAVGDFNIVSHTEATYGTMRSVFNDPANPSGNWIDSSTFANLLSEKATNVQYRDDIQFVTPVADSNSSSPGLQLDQGSLTVFGNGGSSALYRKSVDSSSNSGALTDLPNRAAVLTALEDATDHLPVVADYSIVGFGTAEIGSFSVTPTTVVSGSSITLTASNVVQTMGGTISSVSFYRESNGTGGLQTGGDTLIGTGTRNGTTWTLSTTTTGLAAGNYTYYAVATDSNNTSGPPAATTLTVTSRPSIGSLSANPNSVASGANATLTASNVSDVGGTVTAVNFYRESNGVTGLQIGSDTFVGSGTQNGTTWTLSTSTSGLAPGNYTYYAIAVDNSGVSTAPLSTTLNVTPSKALVDVEILASANPQGPFSSDLSVFPGETVYFEIRGSMADLGTTNGSKTIASLTQGMDGIINLPFNLIDMAAGNIPVTFTTSTLDQNGMGTGSNSGSPAANALNGVKVVANTPGGAPPYGVVANNTPGFQTLLTGTFVIGNNVAGTSSIGETFPTGASGSFKINGGSPVFVTSAALDASYNSFAPLTLTAEVLPSYITPSPGAQFSWDSASGNLLLTNGTLTFTQDQATSGDTTDPLVNLSAVGPTANVVFSTSQHLAGLTLSGGATATVASLGASRTHANHSVLVIGTVDQASAPPFNIDSQSKLDLTDNDMVVHNGSLSNVAAAAATGRNGTPDGLLDGTWTGNGLTSSAAATADSNAGFEQIALAVVRNGDQLFGQASSWQVGSFNEPLRDDGNDIIVKYTYVGDFTLTGQVDANDATIFTTDFGAPSGMTWASGDMNLDGTIDSNDATAFTTVFGTGTDSSDFDQL